VLKAASAAAAEAGPDAAKRIGHQHFESAMEEVISAKTVMQQSLFTQAVSPPDPITTVQNIEARWQAPIVAAVVLASVAFLTSLLAVTLVYLR
jgi:hypothetical protein